ncbi:MAG: histidine kinase dimerization/phosphoacceptor domain -containing protein [Bacteroidota bacterium]|nr:histidine kinase dimerization/phosphoacceptor domain -containing protein [Bacteroidota bacterium]
MENKIKETDSLNSIILNNMSESVFVCDSTFAIIEAHGWLFTNQKLNHTSITDIFPEGSVFLEPKLHFNEKNQTKFLHDFILKDGSVIHTKIRVLSVGDKIERKLVFYVKNNTKAKSQRKVIIKKFLTIEQLSKSRMIREGKLDEAIYEILELAAKATDTQRVNAWVFDTEHTQIKCIGNFDLKLNKFVDQEGLPRIAMPNYFKLFETEKIIHTSDTYSDKKTEEMLEFYLKPHNIRAMMDIPIRIEGDMVGVVCFEKTNSTHEWTLLEQKFGLVVAQMISLAVESHSKLTNQKDLEMAVSEQRILLQEVHHRVKNNLAIVSSLINLQADKAKDEYHRALFEECRNRLNSIATIHQMLYRSKSFSKINFKDYLGEIVNNLYDSYRTGDKEIVITRDLEDINVDLSTGIPLSLIVNEVITNSFKHAFNGRNKGAIHVELRAATSKKRTLIIKDDGPGINPENKDDYSLGMDIISGLVEQIEGKFRFENKGGAVFVLEF